MVLTNLEISKPTQPEWYPITMDIASIKSFLTGLSLIDAPWAPFLIAIFIIHPIPGTVVLVAGFILLGLAWLNEKQTSTAVENHNQSLMELYQFSDMTVRQSDIINSMGMHGAVTDIFDEKHHQSSDQFKSSSQMNSIISSTIKGIRMIIQMVTMAVAAFLAIKGTVSPGSVIAISILSGKALQPFDQAVTIWKSVVSARKAFVRLEKIVSFYSDFTPTQLPKPQPSISVEQVNYAFPNQKEPKIKNLNFKVEPGEIICITGPSAAGKTTICKLLLGIIKPSNGHVRLDHAEISQWDKFDIGIMSATCLKISS